MRRMEIGCKTSQPRIIETFTDLINSAPTVSNPKCDEVSGCGPWEKPTIKNPEYKGKWTAPYIDNPAYKGVWAPRKIKNPDYFEDKTPAKFEPIGAVSSSSALSRHMLT